ncbi:class C sortase [Neoactinobaculum massilliense]|uniref:class C sortase n=1 Tax=Neoactinobaculum massilliense TaxID=2364794 RepID=UPI000F53E480|nr:class C sortase [Neoactinobaculum massilliense]
MQQAERKARTTNLVATLVLAIAAIAVLLYPVVVTQLKNLEQIRVSQSYGRAIESVPSVKLESALASARDYNKNFARGAILDPWLARVSEDNADYQRYLSMLNEEDVMAQVAIPSIGVNLPVYHGTTEEVLQKGVGHLYGTSLPVGGTGTHAVLTGHSGISTATLFDNLPKVKKGDAIYVSVYGEQLKYIVNDIRVVLPSETDSLKIQDGKDLLTLITCTPYGINTHRLLVTGERAPLDATEAQQAFDAPGLVWQWWMIAILVAVVLVVWWMVRQVKAARRAGAKVVVATTPKHMLATVGAAGAGSAGPGSADAEAERSGFGAAGADGTDRAGGVSGTDVPRAGLGTEDDVKDAGDSAEGEHS